MRHDLNIDLVFPIKDEVSAWLMYLKAESLCAIGIIDTDEMSAVLERVAAVLDQADPIDREVSFGHAADAAQPVWLQDVFSHRCRCSHAKGSQCIHDAHIAAASLVSFGSDGLKTSFARNAVGRDFSPSSCKIGTECDGGWIS
jgi:hypothetical protein